MTHSAAMASEILPGPVSYTHLHTQDDTAQFRYFFLEPELRGLGAGHKLMDMALNFCREKNYKHAVSYTHLDVYQRQYFV